MSRNLIHFNNAGTGISNINIIKLISSYMRKEKMYGGYEIAERYSKKIQKLYLNLGRLLNSNKNEVSFIPNTTLGWNLIFSSLKFTKNDEILIFENEYNSNYISMLKRKRDIKKIVISKIDCDGLICEKDFLKNLSKFTKVCSLQHISSQCGNKINIKRICKIIKEYNPNIVIILDCCQSVGQVEINVKSIGCDVLIGSGRKYLCGPRGTGFIYIRNKLRKKIIPVFEDMSTTSIKKNHQLEIRNDSKIFETFEQSIALKLGLSKAVENLLKIGIKKIERKILSLSLHLRKELEKFRQIIFLECMDNLSGINTFYIKDIETAYIYKFLKKNYINTQISDDSVSYLYFKRKRIKNVIRVSLHYYNTKKEIDFFIKKIKNLLI